MIDYLAESEIIKALSEPKRLQILDMLSCGEMCACNMLDSLSITQPTLSHHMKVLMDCGLVAGRKDSTWMYYTINRERVDQLHRFIDFLTGPKEDCVCNPYRKKCND
jgi:ArsR family transcriptional regulator, arsenate/arsenite/antimonite-responsive transcriptional repressor